MYFKFHYKIYISDAAQQFMQLRLSSALILAYRRWGPAHIASDSWHTGPWVDFSDFFQLLIWWRGQYTLVLAKESSCSAFSSLKPSTPGLRPCIHPLAQNTTVVLGGGRSFKAATLATDLLKQEDQQCFDSLWSLARPLRVPRGVVFNHLFFRVICSSRRGDHHHHLHH